MSLFSARRLRTATLAGIVGTVLLGAVPAQAAAAPAPTLTSVKGVTTSVQGYEVTASTTVKASFGASIEYFGVCVRNSANVGFDFVKAKDTWVTPAGVTQTAKQTLKAGTYKIWTCSYDAGVWRSLDASRPLVVVDPDPTTTTTVDTAMPKGDLPGWKQIFTDDFTTDAAAGAFDATYADKFSTYNGFADSFNGGTYNDDIMTVKNGVLDLNLHTDATGRPQVAAPGPITTPGKPWAGQTYGKYSVRFKSDAISGYKTAWLLWPDSNVWNEGEIDFPEGSLNSTIYGYNHCVGKAASNCSYADTKTSFTDWHTATIEWTPKRVTFVLDGQVIANDTKNIPTTPMHWVLQTETNSTNPKTQDGHLQIDWVTVYTYAG